jgi:hypothetical protein
MKAQMIRTQFHRGTAAHLSLLALLLALGAAARAEEAVLTRRALELRAGPGDASAAVASLPQQSPVIRLDGRQGPWVQVRSPQGATGWVHMFDLGPASASGGGTSGGGFVSGALRGVTGLFENPSQRQTGTTAGIRGLEAEDLAKAQPNPAGVQQMTGWRANENDARAYAGRVAWRAAAVEPLPAPTLPRGGETNREQLP